ncbi:MAG: hypothetical protein IIX60_04565, partial [Clostridia bacterium]|nr:hypothetical protein [Clostridia bacterium]
MDDPEPDTTAIIYLLIFVLSVVVCFLVTLGTSALKEVNEKKIRDLAEDGDKKTKRLIRLIDRRPKPTDTASATTTLCLIFGFGAA